MWPTFAKQSGVEHATDIRPEEAQGGRTGEFASHSIAEQHAGGFARQSSSFHESGVSQRLRRRVECEPMCEVGRSKRAARDAEGDSIEFETFNYCGLGGIGAIQHVPV